MMIRMSVSNPPGIMVMSSLLAARPDAFGRSSVATHSACQEIGSKSEAMQALESASGDRGAMV